jgi:predicted ATP-grasp superfamily ATP-dependent carboligase
VSKIEEFVVCPSSEFLNLFLLRNRDSLLRQGCLVPLVELEVYELISNKHSFTAICKKNGIQVPLEFNGPEEAGVPLVARPVKNVNQDGKSLYPYIINNQEDLDGFMEAERPDEFFFQEYIPGDSYYLYYFISRDGRSFTCSQKNILQQAGGKSIVMARAADIHGLPVSESFTRMLLDIGFHGLAMVEVKLQAGGFTAIELNPRLWGPSQLMVDAGSNILKAFIRENLYGTLSGLPAERLKADAVYMWLGGMAENLAEGKKLKWHVRPPRFKVPFVLRQLPHDVYFRKDSLLLFAYELYKTILKR